MIRVVIVDDHAIVRTGLRQFLSEQVDLRVTGEAANGREALDLLAEGGVDLAIVDIHMPDMDGIELARHLNKLPHPPVVIFTTAFHEHALAAFEVDAVAYLLKPVVEDRLRTVVARIEQLVRAPAEASRESARVSAVAGANPAPLRHVLALQKDGYLLVPLDEACFFQVEDGVTFVKTASATYRTNYAIGDLEARLPTPPFFRAHRSTIANLDQVATISPLFKGALLLTMKDAQASEIQVSERQAKHVRALLQI